MISFYFACLFSRWHKGCPYLDCSGHIECLPCQSPSALHSDVCPAKLLKQEAWGVAPTCLWWAKGGGGSKIKDMGKLQPIHSSGFVLHKLYNRCRRTLKLWENSSKIDLNWKDWRKSYFTPWTNAMSPARQSLWHKQYETCWPNKKQKHVLTSPA